jgi:hypothetical protein
MSTVKISQLPLLSIVNANTAQTWFVGVDVPTLATGKFTAHTLAQGLYANEILNVGVNPVLYSNVIGQFSGSDPSYLQVNLQNFNANGSSDYVASTSDSDNANSYIDMGISGKNYNDPTTYGAFKPYDGYVYSHGPSHYSDQGNLILGTASTGAKINFIVGGTQPNNIVGSMTANGLSLNTQSYIVFSDGSIQRTSAATLNYSQAGFAVANTNSANISYLYGVNTTQNTRISGVDNYSTSAFTKANSVGGLAQAGFDYANSSISYLQSVAIQANSNSAVLFGISASQNSSIAYLQTINNQANANISLIFGINETQNTRISGVDNYSTSAYTQANIATGSAQAGFNLANATTGLAQAAFNQANTNASNLSANISYIQAINNTQNTYTQGAYDKANNALANTTGSFGGSLTVAGNVTANYVFVNNDLTFQSTGSIKTAAGVNNLNDIYIQPGADIGGFTGGAVYINSGASAFGGRGGDITLSPNTGTIAAGSVVLSGNVVANTAGTTLSVDNIRSVATSFSGAVNITGAVRTSNIISTISSSTPATNALVEIVGSASGVKSTPSNDGYMLHITGKDAVPNRLVIDGHGTGAYALVAGRSSRGTAASPTASQNNDVLLRISGNGYGATGYAPLGVSRIDFVAAENYTDSARGSRIEFYNAKTGTNTITQIATFNSDFVTFTGVVAPEKGFIYTPTTYPGAQTAIVVDFANNSLIRANCSADISVTHTNYVAGKVVEMWITNTSGQSRTFVHGCVAINSTVNNISYAIPATSSVFVRYTSFYNDLANTFVSIIHS